MSRRHRETWQKGHKPSVHHKRCRSNGGGDEHSNLVTVHTFLHRSWHNLFENKLPPEICEIINEIWLDGRYEFICRKKQPLP
jgi:hypothetical protein